MARKKNDFILCAIGADRCSSWSKGIGRMLAAGDAATTQSSGTNMRAMFRREGGQSIETRLTNRLQLLDRDARGVAHHLVKHEWPRRFKLFISRFGMDVE